MRFFLSFLTGLTMISTAVASPVRVADLRPGELRTGNAGAKASWGRPSVFTSTTNLPVLKSAVDDSHFYLVGWKVRRHKSAPQAVFFANDVCEVTAPKDALTHDTLEIGERWALRTLDVVKAKQSSAVRLRLSRAFSQPHNIEIICALPPSATLEDLAIALDGTFTIVR